MSYFIYARKSRKDAELEALGIDVLERHITTLLELAKTLSLPIGAIYREVVSGDSIDARPVMTQVLSEVEACMWDGALVMDVDRLARGDTIDQGRVQRAFFYSNTRIVTPNKTYDPANEYDNEYFEFSLFMSRREYATIKRRMQRGRERSSSDGYYVGNVAPYGWERVIAPDGKHYSLAPHQTEAPVLDLMYDLCGNKQYGYQKACTYMSNMGILARSGKPFTPSTLKGIISNPANIGKVRWGHRKTVRAVKDGRVVKSRPKATDYILSDAAWAPRISPDLFKRANQPKGCFSAPVRNDRPIQNLFAGLVRCSQCDRLMVRKKAQTKTPYDMLICQYAECSTVGIRIDELEEALLGWLKDYIAKYEFTDTHEEDTAAIAAKELIVTNFETEHQTLLKQRESLFDFLEQGIYTKEIFIERSNALEQRIRDCMNNITAAREDLHTTIARQANQKNFVPKCKNLLSEWDSLTVSEKNSALRQLIDRIVLTKTKRNKKNQKNSEFTIDVYPKVPK